MPRHPPKKIKVAFEAARRDRMQVSWNEENKNPTAARHLTCQRVIPSPCHKEPPSREYNHTLAFRALSFNRICIVGISVIENRITPYGRKGFDRLEAFTHHLEAFAHHLEAFPYAFEAFAYHWEACTYQLEAFAYHSEALGKV